MSKRPNLRFVIFGAGAIGGVVAARLHQSGQAVTVIARGAHLDAIRRDGLTLVTPDEQTVLEMPVAGGPDEIRWTDADVVLLTTKSQDTLQALTALRGAAIEVPVACLQNGVDNERQALRLMSATYAGLVIVPAAHLEPGVVEAYGSGIIDIGGYPSGIDSRCQDMCAALSAAGFVSRPRAEIMRAKYAKLIGNVGNAVDALFAPSAARDDLVRLAREEGRVVLDAAGIAHDDSEVASVVGRAGALPVRDIDGRPRAGTSTQQSLIRGGSLETDYLNGEIVLQGRLHGMPTPINAAICRVAAQTRRRTDDSTAHDAAELLAAVA